MANYAHRKTAPKTLSADEQRRVLQVTGELRGGFRDHLVVSMALSAGLREHEVAALDVGDVARWSANELVIRHRVRLRTFKGCGRAPGTHQEINMPPSLRLKLRAYLEGHHHAPRSLTEPLFRSREEQRLSTRQIRNLWQRWQTRAGLERKFTFHELRHTYCTNVYRESGRDILQVQRLARHTRLETTTIYTHPSEDEIATTVSRL